MLAIEIATGQSGPSADRRPQSGITRNRANERSTGGPRSPTRERPLLRLGHAGTTTHGDHGHHDQHD